jgi:hypothetical protein
VGPRGVSTSPIARAAGGDPGRPGTADAPIVTDGLHVEEIADLRRDEDRRRRVGDPAARIPAQDWTTREDTERTGRTARTNAPDHRPLDGLGHTRRTVSRRLKPPRWQHHVGSNPTPGTQTSRSGGARSAGIRGRTHGLHGFLHRTERHRLAGAHWTDCTDERARSPGTLRTAPHQKDRTVVAAVGHRRGGETQSTVACSLSSCPFTTHQRSSRSLIGSPM